MITLFLAALAATPPYVRDLLPQNPDQPGCVLNVRQSGKTIAQTATGLANMESGTHNQADTIFEVGSVSKQFIGAGLAKLAADGRLSLGDPIRRWLPELPPLYEGITVSMLAHHTSGIRSWNNLAELTGRGEGSTGYDNAWVLQAVARQRHLNNPPGTEYLYSNSNFVLGALIIGRVSGEPLNAFYRRAFFEPLGMRSSRWRTDFQEVVPHRAQAYGPGKNEAFRLDVPLNNVAGAGGLLSNVEDLQRWAAVLAEPPPEHRSWVGLLLKPGTLNDGTVLRYGMGIELAPVSGQRAYSHAGSTGSYRAWLGLFPDQQLSVALLCNNGAVNTKDLGPEVAARFLPPQVQTAAQPRTAPLSLAGLYRNLANDSVVEVTVDAAGLRLGGGTAFAGDGDLLLTADGRRSVKVERSASGQVKALHVTRTGNSTVTIERVQPWSPTGPELRKFLGLYRSAEVDGLQKIERNGNGLIWRDPSGAATPLRPLYKDTFEAVGSSWTLRFRSRANGRMNLDMSITRARRVTFFSTLR